MSGRDTGQYVVKRFGFRILDDTVLNARNESQGACCRASINDGSAFVLQKETLLIGPIPYPNVMVPTTKDSGIVTRSLDLRSILATSPVGSTDGENPALRRRDRSIAREPFNAVAE